MSPETSTNEAVNEAEMVGRAVAEDRKTIVLTSRQRRFAAALDRKDRKKEAKASFVYGKIVNETEWQNSKLHRSERV